MNIKFGQQPPEYVRCVRLAHTKKHLSPRLTLGKLYKVVRCSPNRHEGLVGIRNNHNILIDYSAANFEPAGDVTDDRHNH